jgi:hypothetical protein
MLFEAGGAAATRAGATRGLHRMLWPLAVAAAILMACVFGVAWNAERTGRRQLEIALHAASQRRADPNENDRDEAANVRLVEQDDPRGHPPVEPSSYLMLVHQIVLSRGEEEPTDHARQPEVRPPQPTLPARGQSPLRARDLKRVIAL